MPPRDSRVMYGDARAHHKQQLVAAAIDLVLMVGGLALSAWVFSKVMDPHAEEKKKAKERLRSFKKDVLKNANINLTSHELVSGGAAFILSSHIDTAIIGVNGRGLGVKVKKEASELPHPLSFPRNPLSNLSSF
jgi:hypothetical protein